MCIYRNVYIYIYKHSALFGEVCTPANMTNGFRKSRRGIALEFIA